MPGGKTRQEEALLMGVVQQAIKARSLGILEKRFVFIKEREAFSCIEFISFKDALITDFAARKP
jgi:hypothetical protein